jgi:hypothetical protein
MAKIILEFDPIEEREEAQIAIRATSYHGALSNFAEYLHNLDDHAELTVDQKKLLEDIRIVFKEETEDLDIY